MRTSTNTFTTCLKLVYGVLFLLITEADAQVHSTNTGTMYVSPGTIIADEGDFTNNGSTTVENGGNFYIKGNWTNNGTYVTNTGKMFFWGNTAQAIGGTSPCTFYQMEVNKPSNGVTLNTNTVVSNMLTLTSGPVDLNSKQLTVASSATNAIGYTNGYLISDKTDNSSKVQWNIGSTTGAHIIPFGKASGLIIPLTLDLTSGNIGNVTASTYYTGAANTPLPTTPDLVLHVNDAYGHNNSANTVDRFWQVNKTGGGGVMTMTFTYDDTEKPANGEVNLRAQRYGISYNGWDTPVPFQTSDATLNTVISPGVTVLGPFTLSLTSTPLPVELLMFTAAPNRQRQVEINWETASETGNHYFTVERSKDGLHFEEIDKVNGAGNSSVLLYYKTLDRKPLSGISYYRLKQTDFNGSFIYSKSVKVTLDGNNAGISLFYNAACGCACIHFSSIEENLQDINVSIFDNTGKNIASHLLSQMNSPDGHTFQFEGNTIAPGIYFVQIFDKTKQLFSSKIIF